MVGVQDPLEGHLFCLREGEEDGLGEPVLLRLPEPMPTLSATSDMLPHRHKGYKHHRTYLSDLRIVTMWRYLYLDESGDLGRRPGSSRYIVLSALVVDDPLPLDRIIKNVRRHKFRKELRKAREIKANKSSPNLRRHMLQELNKVPNAQVFHMILEKRRMYSGYLLQDRHKQYNFIAGKLAGHILLRGADVEIRIDRSKGAQILQEDFNRYFERKLRERSEVLKVKIFHSHSESWSGLQFADLLAWAAFQKVEHSDPSYVDILKTPQETYSVW